MENDLISRSEAIEALLKQPNTPTPSVIRRVLRQVPGVDAVEVVRCKDCMFWDSGENEEERWEWCKLHRLCIGPHSFCSCGERRDENAAG